MYTNPQKWMSTRMSMFDECYTEYLFRSQTHSPEVLRRSTSTLAVEIIISSWQQRAYEVRLPHCDALCRSIVLRGKGKKAIFIDRKYYVVSVFFLCLLQINTYIHKLMFMYMNVSTLVLGL